MQTIISEQANLLVEHLNTLVNSTQHLEDKFHSKLIKMSVKMDEFVTEFHNHAAMPIGDYASYLNHDALSPLTIVLGYAELFRSVHAHILSSDELFIINSVCDLIRSLTDNVRHERNMLVAKRNLL